MITVVFEEVFFWIFISKTYVSRGSAENIWTAARIYVKSHKFLTSLWYQFVNHEIFFFWNLYSIKCMQWYVNRLKLTHMELWICWTISVRWMAKTRIPISVGLCESAWILVFSYSRLNKLLNFIILSNVFFQVLYYGGSFECQLEIRM